MLRSDIPSNAVERVTKKHRNGRKVEAHYFLRGAKVGWRCWYESGQLESEFPSKRGVYHGTARLWHPNGQLRWQSRYLNGKEHGVARQWDEEGRPLGVYRMSHGTGIDRWWDKGGRRRYSLTEERRYVNGRPHGRERQWSGKQLTEEGYWKYGQRHGIWRRWRLDGRLERSFPHYYLHGRMVTRARYLKACKTDRTMRG